MATREGAGGQIPGPHDAQPRPVHRDEPVDIRCCCRPVRRTTASRCTTGSIPTISGWSSLSSSARDHTGLAWSVYAAPSGEPALSPVAFMHRPSAMDNPPAPLGHHWQDATHVSFGVLTGALFSKLLAARRARTSTAVSPTRRAATSIRSDLIHIRRG